MTIKKNLREVARRVKERKEREAAELQAALADIRALEEEDDRKEKRPLYDAVVADLKKVLEQHGASVRSDCCCCGGLKIEIAGLEWDLADDPFP